MAAFLKIVSGIYLVFVWLIFALILVAPTPQGVVGYAGLYVPLIFLICILLSIPAVALFAFGQVVGDVRAMRDHLRVMRAYYEPARQ